MKVEIWSDIMCPFCYIGKRKFENALQQFAGRETVEVQWRSFELDPNMQTVPGQSIHELLAARKGVSVEQGKQMNDHMAVIAAEVGLHYDFDRMIPTNTFLAHRFLHLAAAHGLQDAAEERVFAAYFVEGKNVGDLNTLAQLGAELGLDAMEVTRLLETEAYAQQVRLDEYEAQQVGARGVPFFVFNNKYAVSGAQPSELFLEVLQKVQSEEQPVVVAGAEGAACDVDGAC
ncbi:DsbA family oxidoreductase [Hymenobacter crusticola]|uniref:Disulfide bond formation protein DsbA n=1 Tax=Hymenobacter crusticola TaxID=1770526 RepID=A0A243WIM0_9BACT|nr:DsbA family oxidoreductase [Hymenobacter crusticola]OUJ75743.1 disulfide bond formation protein DsbA [Hymenobacter crusticola]